MDSIAFLICRGGWPRSITVPHKPALRQAFDYFDAIVNDDINRVDEVKKDTPSFSHNLLTTNSRGIIMTSIIMVKDLLNEERVKTLAYVLDNAGIINFYQFKDPTHFAFTIEKVLKYRMNKRYLSTFYHLKYAGDIKDYSRFKYWLVTITHNECKRLFRSNRDKGMVLPFRSEYSAFRQFHRWKAVRNTSR